MGFLLGLFGVACVVVIGTVAVGACVVYAVGSAMKAASEMLFGKPLE